MNGTKKSRYVIYIEFMQPQNPEHIEHQLRYSIEKRILPPIKELMIGIDHKNMKPSVSSDMPLIIAESNDLKG